MTDAEDDRTDAENVTGDAETATSNAENTATDAETVVAGPHIARRLGYIHQTLELIALLLAVLLLDSGGLGTIAGGCAVVLLVGNAITRALD